MCNRGAGTFANENLSVGNSNRGRRESKRLAVGSQEDIFNNKLGTTLTRLVTATKPLA